MAYDKKMIGTFYVIFRIKISSKIRSGKYLKIIDMYGSDNELIESLADVHSENIIGDPMSLLKDLLAEPTDNKCVNEFKE